MAKLGRILGITGIVALVSVPLTLFLWDWQFTWVAIAKLTFGVVAIAFWLATNAGGIRETFEGRSAFYLSLSSLFVVMVLFALVVVNYYFHVRPYEFDLTQEKIFSLSDQTGKILDELEDVVEVRAFYGSADPGYPIIKALLERYRYASDRFVYEFVDPERQLEQVQKHKVNLGGPRILLTYREREERVKIGQQEQSSPEEAITAALLNLTGSETKNQICFTTGHGEKSLTGQDPQQSMTEWSRHLQTEGYRSKGVSLLELAAVPEECKAVVVAGPSNDLTSGEVDSLNAYLSGGGKLMVFLGSGDSASLNAMLEKYGVRVGADTVIFPAGRSPLAVVTDPTRYPKNHPIFSRFFQGGMTILNQLQAVLPLSRSVRRIAVPHLQVTELVYSTANAWAEKDDVQQVDQVVFDEGSDLRGPVSLAVAVEKKSDAKAAPGDFRLVVFGSSLFAVDLAYRMYQFNPNLVMNTLAWLIREEKKITIRPRLRAASLLRLEESEMKFVTFFTFDIIPLLILAFGISVWQIRRWA